MYGYHRELHGPAHSFPTRGASALAGTFIVASVPAMVPSDFAVRLAIVARIKTPSVARGPSPRAPTEGGGSRRHRSAAKGEPRTGLTALGDRAPQTGAK